MSNLLAVPESTAGAHMTRTRSSSQPPTRQDTEQNETTKTRPSRPSHFRSRSYISSNDLKPISSATFPPLLPEKTNESLKFPRLHLPGKHHHNKSISKDEAKPITRPHGAKHRYTQSESQQYHRKRDSGVSNYESPATSAAPNSASTTSEQAHDFMYPTSRGTAIPSLARMPSARSYRGNPEKMYSAKAEADPRSGLRRRATSDPRSPTHNHSPTTLSRPIRKSQIELELERADIRRQVIRESVTEADVKRKDELLKAGRGELSQRLTNTNRSASDLMRRLDDAQDTLFRTTESLVDTISSFSNLYDQSSKLISNFEHESHHLDRDIRQRIAYFRDSICVKRGQRVDALERRSQAMSEKAAELGRRLENCRTIVTNWEEREANKRRAWRGVWVGVLWGVSLIALAVLVGVASWKAADIRRGGGTAELRLHRLIVRNRSHDTEVVQNLQVPDHVKEVLLDIDRRVRGGGDPVDGLGVAGESMSVHDDRTADDRGLRLLDEL